MSPQQFQDTLAGDVTLAKMPAQLLDHFSPVRLAHSQKARTAKIDGWTAENADRRINTRQIIFELKGELHEKVAREAFRLAGAKMPGTYEFVKKGDAPVVGITKLSKDVTLQSLKEARRPIVRKDPRPEGITSPEAEQLRHLGVAVVALSYASVPLYKMICQQMGWSGQPVKAHNGPGGDSAERLRPVQDHRRLRITFQGSVSDVLPWKFTPQQREVRVLPGETALAFYTATNKSEADIIGVATYSVTPAQVAPYFSKIQCFCFEEQRLAAGETVDMPVFFFIDPDFVKDPNMRGIDTITLSYTFFKAKYDKNGVLTTVPMAMA
ncbi:hypothetical protein DV738_g2939, partial [Chaetothyriales sp. CBS 135597]